MPISLLAENFASAEAQAPFTASWHKAATPVKHTFTHFHLLLDVYRTELPVHAPAPAGHWWSESQELDGEALPTVMRKAVAAGLGKAIKGRS